MSKQIDYSARQLKRGFTPEQLRNFEKWYAQVSKKIEVSDVLGPVRAGPPRREDTPRFRPVGLPPPEEDLQKNLEKLVKLALDLGAADARVLPTKELSQDIRALYVDCMFPRCRWLNTNVFCPKKVMFLFAHMQQFVSDYRFAIVYKVLPPKVEDVPDVGGIDLDMYYTMAGGPPPDKAMLTRNIIRLRILSEMTRRLQQVAFYSGYVEAAPISAGPCLVTKCASKRSCVAMNVGEICPFVDVEPRGQVVYIDYYGLGRKLGWGELQAGGNCAFPEDAPEPDGYYNIGVHLID